MRSLIFAAALLAAQHAYAGIVCDAPSSTATLLPKTAPAVDPPAKRAHADIPLPRLDVPFVPAPEGPERLKGIGLLRQCLGTN